MIDYFIYYGEENMINYIIPIIVVVIIIYGYYKKINIYDSFIDGVKEGIDICFNLFPTIFALIISINVLIKSNVINDFTNFLIPVFNFLKFPKELFTLSILRPISGSSSLIVLNEILKNNGPDSLIGRIASVIQGSTDTTIYIISLYFSSVGIKKIKYSLLVGLLADLACIIISIVVVNLFFWWYYFYNKLKIWYNICKNGCV